jgi:hypothetical protein
MIQVSRVIPTLFDRREVHAYLATDEGGFRRAVAPLELPDGVLHLERAPEPVGLVALTDEGFSALRVDLDGPRPGMRLEPVLAGAPVLARSGAFYPTLRLVHDVDGDGRGDLLLPTRDGLRIHLVGEAGVEPVAADVIETDGKETRGTRWLVRGYPLPQVRDVDGDGLPDLVFGSSEPGGAAPLHVYLGTGAGRFGPLREKPEDCLDTLTDLRIRRSARDPRGDDDARASPWPTDLAALRDLDGDGRAEAVLRTQRTRGDSMRKELKDAKRPIQWLRFHRLDRPGPDGDGLRLESQPYFETEVIGHTLDGAFADDAENPTPFDFEQFSDLDGDGREDLVTITLDFSLFQAVRIMTTKRISIGVDFHVYAQHEDGSFHEVPDLDLSEKLKFDLDDLSLGRFAQFAGDFDGDGRQDFVHLGRGSTVTIHRGRDGCRYPEKADLTIELDAEPEGLDLVRIEDLDGDGRADLRITRPQESADPDTTAPVRLELYLSGPVG